ncbi:CheR family methyltransferase [Dethiosulfovibrio salsuginis]|uniref:MCP methyltransferase, CheR-type n=1 Tax=Dethiosulfovibrio salsuginis TaxID=561720 RepID=A0A1X7K2V2_9BACT|nr:protein-glutamate O-methyltransferase CheR [Dethiosulfovibrio salsuginis]SMG35265.1 MCP methyltransferase, CheR-type [Dethiosulfovibrio salsuginis]
MSSLRLLPEDLDKLVYSIKNRFGIVLGSDIQKAREKAALLVRDLSQDLDERQDKIVTWIIERSDRTFVEVISPYITVGETYFFRDRKILSSFKEDILPSLVSSPKRPIKVWSAGCSTGEEPYTLAMIMEDSTLGLGGGFRVYGTDLNESSLKKARRGIYGKWSFRGMNDTEITRYFDPFEDGFFQVKGRYRSAVSFDSANLVASATPWRSGEIDVIFCRNVMMYFDDDSRKKVLEGFLEALSPEGWLVVAACETSLMEESHFYPVHLGGQTFFRPFESEPPFCAFPSEVGGESHESPWGNENDDDYEEYETGLYEPLPVDPRADSTEPEADIPDIGLIHSLADRGETERALELCLSLGNSTDPYIHYLTSIIYQDMGDLDGAKETLRKALFLDPSFVMAHYSLLGIAISEGNQRERSRHVRNLRELLLGMPGEETVPYGDGATAKDLLSALNNL